VAKLSKRKATANQRQSGASETARNLWFAPIYAIQEAHAAFREIKRLDKSRSLRNGIYYVVLVDLVGSTKYRFSAVNERLTKRIERFVNACINAVSKCKPQSRVYFIKEIGDAVLLLFQHFPDVVRWRELVTRKLTN